jgi:epoxide hydrolase-like predicted phosphatase
MIKTVIFDMGGVILRTIDPAPRERMAERFGCSRAELEDFVFSSPISLQSEIGQLDDMEHWRVVLENFHQTDITPLEAYYEFFSGDDIDQELLNFARSLKKERKIGLLSNAWVNARQRLGRLYEFIDVFDVAVFSSEVGVRKPEKAIFDLMLEKLDVEPQEAIFVDDFLINVRGAEEAGLHSILFMNKIDTIREVNTLLTSV